MDPENRDTPGGSNYRVISRKRLYDKMQEQNLPNLEEKLNYLENKLLTHGDYSQEQIRELKHKFSYIKSEFKRRRSKGKRQEDKLLKENDWLQGTFQIPKSSHGRVGRPLKPFSELSERSRRRKTEQLRNTVSKEALVHAAKVSLQSSGNRDASQVLTELVKSPKRGTKYKKAYATHLQVNATQLTPLRSLSTFVEADLSRKHYEVIRDSNKNITLVIPYCKRKNNPTPSSPRYCRPIRISFIKETTDTTNNEIKYIQNQIDALENSVFTREGISASVKHAMAFTMVDEKVCNAATQTASTMKCYICGATPKLFNDLSIKRDVDSGALSFGLSILHARIRLFQSILHLSYKLPVKKWQLRSEADKTVVKERKGEIQKVFREETGLIVDVPKANFGNTNDGNTSRRFFAEPQKANSEELTDKEQNESDDEPCP
ncbi:unnamed protein product [Acanthoscelides obtectus]|uniref:Uncharacterized protein n=1 Tax=Acanthoscelides obtectus TaxID=200917 RepID=A0A9P0PHK9_ACAOB|nr:unnamed protein product [Acanthoscelides obtectus]CAK1646009.1 hypothetical protein AOBTE_LOCUS14392 [Acanthoscelides obtectus]